MVKQACREWKSKETSEGQHDCQEAFKTHFRYMVTDLKRYQSTCFTLVSVSCTSAEREKLDLKKVVLLQGSIKKQKKGK